MKIVIIEDEGRIAKRLERMTRSFFEQNLSGLTLCDSLAKGMAYIENHPVDLLLLDLNLNGENGFEVLECVVAGSFHTIIVSAYTDKAIMAFEHGVLDFVPKPFDEARLWQAFRRLTTGLKQVENKLAFLAVKKSGDLRLIDINDLLYIKGAGIYSELHLKEGRQELHDKSLEMLEQLLPPAFIRIHRSYIILLKEVEKLTVQSGSRYHLLLKNKELLPVSRLRYKELKTRLI